MDFKQKKMIKLGIMLGIIIIALAVFMLNGINLGLDLEGGSSIVMEAQPEEGQTITPEQLQAIRNILESRVNELGLTEPVIQTRGENRIIIELPAVDNPHEAIEAIGRTAVLTVRNQQGDILMRGEHITDARTTTDQHGRPAVSFRLDREGGQQFFQITTEYLNRNIGFYLDDEQLTMGPVRSQIRDEGQIAPFGSMREAQEIAVLIREGALPVPLTVAESRNVGATLGRISLQRSIIAGLLGLLVVSIYMIFYYRFPGFLVALVLAVYGILLMGTLSLLGATMTLPGVAGLVLSIGMAVDANIIIYERIKDERKSGKGLKSAIDAGFSRAYRTIIDANVTTLIAALILAFYTAGVVRGFAIILGIGILVSMFTAFFVTRIILDLFLETALLKSEKSFGAQRR